MGCRRSRHGAASHVGFGLLSICPAVPPRPDIAPSGLGAGRGSSNLIAVPALAALPCLTASASYRPGLRPPSFRAGECRVDWLPLPPVAFDNGCRASPSPCSIALPRLSTASTGPPTQEHRCAARRPYAVGCWPHGICAAPSLLPPPLVPTAISARRLLCSAGLQQQQLAHGWSRWCVAAAACLPFCRSSQQRVTYSGICSPSK